MLFLHLCIIQSLICLKVNYHSLGPGATWEYLEKVSPAIPTLRGLQRHMEQQFETITRGSKHTNPDKEADITSLVDQCVKSQLHIHEKGRHLRGGEKSRAHDFVTEGAADLLTGDTLNNWWTNRSF